MGARSLSEQHLAELGFTLLEMVVAVGIAAMLLIAGGIWMLGMRPGSLRNAADDFDAELGVARGVASGSGNGATIAFTPQTGGGFTVRIYSGRPNVADGVKATTVMALTSNASVSEATFGKPPFAIFLSSAGYPTGTGQYPTIAGDGSVSFPVIAHQPPCPPNNIVLTFTDAQGATATRTLQCNREVAGGTSSANPSPTPNALKLNPTFMLAHWTSDAGPLHFIAAEFGYTHWYASRIGNTCIVQSSDTGGAPATFASGWPYAQPNSPSELTLAPAPPPNPYSWPHVDPDDPPAPFQLMPTLHDGGLCTVRIVDHYGQEADASVQVMGDLTPSAPSLTFASPTSPAQTVSFGKTFDTEQLKLQASSACAGVVTVSIPTPPTAQSTPSTTPTTATMTITPVAAGSCTLIVGDQYGEPTLSIPITVKARAFRTWPASLVLGVNGGAVGTTTGTLAYAAPQSMFARLSPLMNKLLAGGTALASSYSGPCYAQAFQSGTSGAADTTLVSGYPNVATALGITVATDGCILNANGSGPYGGTSHVGVIAAYEPSGQTGNYNGIPQGGCVANLATGPWNPPNASGVQASEPATGTTQGTCTINYTDGVTTATPAPDAGKVAISVAQAYSVQLLWIGMSCYGDQICEPPYVWMAYAVPAGGTISETNTCTGVIVNPNPPPLHMCGGYSTTIMPAGALPICEFETTVYQNAIGNFYLATDVDGYFWSSFIGGSWQDQPNSIGYGCANVTLGTPYYSGSI